LELSQDDKLAKPSFEAYPAGYELGDDSFEIGEVLEETLNYEEADLGAVPEPKRQRRLGLGAYSQAAHGTMLQFGAAGRSSLRDRALTQPAQSAAIKVDPVPVTITAKNTLTVTAGAGIYTSVFRAEQARDSVVTVATTRLAVVEVSELA
jgi:hypothetical protein